MTFTHRAINIAATLLAAMFLFACTKSPEASPVVRVGGSTMGTTWVTTLTPPANSSLGDEQWTALIQAALDEVDGAMSTYQDDSDLNRFTRAKAGEAIDLSPHTQTVLQASRQVHRLSNGAFDPTIGALLQLWGFGAKRSSQVQEQATDTPDPAAIAALLASLGLSKVESRNGDASIFAQDPGALFLDFSAIAKGYGVDHAAQTLRAQGVESFLVEVGGEVVVQGERPGGGTWRLAIESPFADRPELAARLTFTDRALATSGNYRNFRELAGGTIISHTIDPRTGRPVLDPPASVSVLAQSCMLADAWATALSVLGPPGLEIIEGIDDLEARMVITAQGEEPERIRTTTGWPTVP